MTEEIMALCRAMGATEDQEGLLLPLAQASAQALERAAEAGDLPRLVWSRLPSGCRHAGYGWAERAVEAAECPPSPPEKCPSVWGERPERAA